MGRMIRKAQRNTNEEEKVVQFGKYTLYRK